MTVIYSFDKTIPLPDLCSLYKDSFLESPRPVDDMAAMQNMLENATIVVSAWDNETLVGVCRCLSDFSYVTYVSDLAVHKDWQRKGIGQQLLKYVREKSGPTCKLVLLSNIQANSYYPKLGFSQHDRAWIREEKDTK